MQVHFENDQFTIAGLTTDQLELLEEGLIHLQHALSIGSEFLNQRGDCAEMFLAIDIELVNMKTERYVASNTVS
jgi:hypothetical protein